MCATMNVRSVEDVADFEDQNERIAKVHPEFSTHRSSGKSINTDLNIGRDPWIILRPRQISRKGRRDECRADDLIGKYQPDTALTRRGPDIYSIHPKKKVYVVVGRLFTVDLQYSALRNRTVVDF